MRKTISTDEEFKYALLHVAYQEMRNIGAKKTKPMSQSEWMNLIKKYGYVISDALLEKDKKQ